MRKLAEPDYRPRMWREGRAWREYVGLLNDPVFQGVGVQRGQGRPVLLVPGFMAGDRSLRVLGAWLKRMVDEGHVHCRQSLAGAEPRSP